MTRVIWLAVLGFTALLSPITVRADVQAISLIKLTQLEILAPTGYSVSFPFGVLATASASAQDDLGSDAQFDFELDADASASAATTFASAKATAEALALTANAESELHIPGASNIFASSSANGNPFGSLSGSFEVDGPAGTIPVALQAGLSYSQLVKTDALGLFATSDVIFNFLLPDIGFSLPVFESLLIIGPNAMASQSGAPTLFDMVMLQANTPYSFVAGVDAESSGLNVPEPSSVVLTATVFACIVIFFRRQRLSRGRASC
jgi:hypothetical protein